MAGDVRVPLLPDGFAGAQLPVAYEAAKDALAKCDEIDECKDWADKAAAIASYARQAHDDTLLLLAIKIRLRPLRRAGELLMEIPRPAQGGRPRKNRAGNQPVSRKRAAAAAGLSGHQMKQAIRLATIPGDTFEKQIEADDPPTVTDLAAQGRKPGQKSDPSVFDSKYVPTAISDLADIARKTEPASVLHRCSSERRGQLLEQSFAICEWLTSLSDQMKRLT